MNTTFIPRDYSLVGEESKRAEKRGLASAEWYACPISRKRLKELMRRNDGPAIRDTLIWISGLITAGWLGHLTWGTWWALPCFIVYGVLYCTASDSRWHECGHRTAFRTTWMNDVIYEIASFMVFRESVAWRWSHTRHHTDTIIVGRDREIPAPRPPSLSKLLFNFVNFVAAPAEFRRMLLHCVGRITPEEATFIPASELPRLFRNARIYVGIYLAVIIAAVAGRSILPLMYIGLPSFYGAWLMVIFGYTQHLGLAEDVLDHRLNCRTVNMNPVFRFIYWNMNYHVEHHMFPMIPYHALPALHEEIKGDMPTPYTSIFNAYCEIVPAVLRQIKDPSYFVTRPLPASMRREDGMAESPCNA